LIGVFQSSWPWWRHRGQTDRLLSSKAAAGKQLFGIFQNMDLKMEGDIKIQDSDSYKLARKLLQDI
jgi:hypothetical protein